VAVGVGVGVGVVVDVGEVGDEASPPDLALPPPPQATPIEHSRTSGTTHFNFTPASFG
jgi:hypothetical protein